MGLDMYLRAERYVSGWAHEKQNEKDCYRAVLMTLGLPLNVCTYCPSMTVSVTVAYWRKSNAIHAWFVDHCQEGVDECQKTEVSREQLEELLALCKSVTLENAEQLLPPKGGFFFGSTTIDEDFMEYDIKPTILQLEAALTLPKEWYFVYQSSW